jgi:hypothetical protein
VELSRPYSFGLLGDLGNSKTRCFRHRSVPEFTSILFQPKINPDKKSHIVIVVLVSTPTHPNSEFVSSNTDDYEKFFGVALDLQQQHQQQQQQQSLILHHRRPSNGRNDIIYPNDTSGNDGSSE